MISIKKGRPSLYKALPPDEAMVNLKQALDEDYQQKVIMLEALTTKFSRLYESVENKEEMELAYVIHGIRGIFEKMNNLIRQAQQSLLVFVPDMDFWNRVEQSLIEAAERGVKIELGLHEKFEQTPLIERLGTVKRVECQYGLLLVDDQTLLDRYGEMAVLTQKPTIIQYTREVARGITDFPIVFDRAVGIEQQYPQSPPVGSPIIVIMSTGSNIGDAITIEISQRSNMET